MPAETPTLSRRERQIMDIVYQRGQAAVSDVIDAMDDPPSYSAVRALMNVLERKGHLRHSRDGLRYVYRPTRPRQQAARAALRRTVQTFFEGSPQKAVAALLDMSDMNLTDEQLRDLARRIEEAGRKS